MASTVSSLRPVFMADLDASAERTAAVLAAYPNAGDGSGAFERQAAAEAEEATALRWQAASADVEAYLQRQAELEAGL